MDKQQAKELIAEIGREQGYHVYEDNTQLQIYFERDKHGVAFKIVDSTHERARQENWLQVHQWECDDFGAALHSLRSLSDVVAFCQTLVTFSQIKARRL
ncbi:hypothetical protein [Photobacterium atrarenae]|uniref:Uncharacterized protein n=1 Tax=Photobacterium atrarenae TaxID=865757 RepID=A0ABY5GNZ6_9GAMM|nr:hypothetical protein [Photobacterium atrarenae]UTV30809.1 hypothetical protein NNL38_19825 [Photobacterium atrarenae]